MSNETDSASGAGVRAGQRYKRVDGAGLVFEVVEAVSVFRQPHYRLRRVDEPTDLRVFACSALADRQIFRAVETAPTEEYAPQHLKAS